MIVNDKNRQKNLQRNAECFLLMMTKFGYSGIPCIRIPLLNCSYTYYIVIVFKVLSLTIFFSSGFKTIFFSCITYNVHEQYIFYFFFKIAGFSIIQFIYDSDCFKVNSFQSAVDIIMHVTIQLNQILKVRLTGSASYQSPMLCVAFVLNLIM